MSIPVDDTDEEDLLSHLPQAIDFIQKGLASGGTVLVHCIQGVSRSPTVVASYLMLTEHLGHTEAIGRVKHMKHDIQPNDGFEQQLKVWKEMEYKLDKEHPYFKDRALKALSEQQLAGETVSREALAIPEEKAASKGVLYRCRKCRRLVATSANEAPMYLVKQAGDGAPQFAGKRMNGKDTGPSKDSQLFVEPMQWMDEVIDGAVQGKLHCPGCQGRLGTFNWAGMQNNNGAWVTPAFALYLSKLDAMQSSSEATKLHRPPLS